MKIGFDAKRIARNGTGLGSYGRTLVNALSEAAPQYELRLYAPDKGREDLCQQVNAADNIVWCYPSGMTFRLQRDLWRMRGMVKDLQRDDIDIFHGLSGELPHGLRKAGIRSIVTIHDLIFLRHPEYYNWIDVEIYHHKFRQTIKEADVIVAISECTKRDIMAYSDVPEDRIKVIYQSCSTRFCHEVDSRTRKDVARRYVLPRRYVLQVGTIEERKNAMLTVRALPLLPEDVHFVLVGRQTAYADKVRREAEKLGVSNRVLFLSGVPNDDLYAIYQQASVFVYPSRYEGFGIPVIEAIQSYLPVVAATGSCLEEAGGPDCLYVDPDDHKAMASAIMLMMPVGTDINYDDAEGHNRSIRERISRSRDYVTRFENNDVARQWIELYSSL